MTVSITTTPLSLKALHLSSANLYRPFINPYAQEVEAEVEKFMLRHDLDFKGLHGSNTMAAYMYPQADADTMLAIGMLITALFYIDDLYGDMPGSQQLGIAPVPAVANTIERLLAVLNGELQPKTSLEMAFQKIRSHIFRLNPPIAWQRRFLTSMRHHLTSAINPTLYSDQAITDPVERFVQLRMHVSGMVPTVDLIELACKQYIPAHTRATDDFQAILRGSSAIPALTNDLFSYEKEVVRDNLPLNFVRIIQEAHYIDLRHAFEVAIAWINHETGLYLNTLDTIEQDRQVAQAYIDGLKYQLSATWHWQIDTPRYRSATSPFAELRTD